MLRLEQAHGKRKCGKCKLPITKGEYCITYRAGFGANASSGNLCLFCLAQNLKDNQITIPETRKEGN